MHEPDDIRTPEHITAGRDLAERVEELVRDGRPGAARRELQANWRDTVPDLPERFPVRLRKINRDPLTAIALRLRGRAHPPELRFDFSGPDGVSVRSVEDDDLIIGWLKPSDAHYLADLGDDAALYRPQLLEIGTDHRGVTSVALSVVRPELRICSSCTRRHSGAHVNCAECRSKRRRKGPESDSYEPAPVPFHEAVEATLDALGACQRSRASSGRLGSMRAWRLGMPAPARRPGRCRWSASTIWWRRTTGTGGLSRW